MPINPMPEGWPYHGVPYEELPREWREWLDALPPKRRSPSRLPPPCKRCNGPKPPRRSLYCETCHDELDLDEHGHRRRMCSRCGVKPKRFGQGVSLCEDCEPVDATMQSWCRKCGGPRDPCLGGRRLCADCRQLERDANAARKRFRRDQARKPCVACGKRKEKGTRSAYCARCKVARAIRPCPGLGAAAYQRTGGLWFPAVPCGRPIEVKGAKRCLLCKAEGRRRNQQVKSARHAYRLRNDPTYRGHRNKLERDRRRTVGAKPKPKDWRATTSLPGAPLAEMIDKEIERSGMDLGPITERLQIDGNQVRHWRNGRSVRIGIIDKVLTLLPAEWWEVWHEEAEGYHEALGLFG